MRRILLLLDHPPNRRLLAQWLTQHYEVVPGGDERVLQEPFDVGIVDGPALHRIWEAVEARKKAEEPVFLPVLLMTSRHSVDVAMRHLWRTVDEVVLRPVEKLELQARVEILLRARHLSLALKRRHDDLESFMQVMAHDLRAPVRIAEGFARELLADEGTTLSEDGRACLGRILSATGTMQQLMSALLEFARIGPGAVRLQPVSVRQMVDTCLGSLRNEIRRTHARIEVDTGEATVVADPTLLRVALSNLLANALKFVTPETVPHLVIAASETPAGNRLSVRDNGIGIAPAHQARIFKPFVRLHGVEEYSGFGLGLAAVQKAMELMGGDVGVSSAEGQGSTFWMEFGRLEVRGEIFNC